MIIQKELINDCLKPKDIDNKQFGELFYYYFSLKIKL
jgi:hypothetical protein